MGWIGQVWRGREQKAEAPAVSGEENVLVISDVHLGEDILAEGPEHLSAYIQVLNRELADFISWHRDNLREGRRWHLVINGDMFDFVKVSLRPDAEEALVRWRRELTPLEYERGLDNSASHVVWKLERILDIHRPLFKQIAAFLLAGNRVTLVEGNHDAEFYFSEVQKTLTDFVVRLAERLHQEGKVVPQGKFAPDAVASRLAFCGWFEASPGRFHIEHGHQYDEMCSFEYNLAPYDGEQAQTLATPMSHRPMPYVADLLGDFSTHNIDKLTSGQVLLFLRTLGPRTFLRVLRIYFTVVTQLFRRAGAKRRRELRAMEEEHHKRLRALAETSPYGYGTLASLDRLKATPAEFFAHKILHIFYLDRALVGVLVALGLLGTFFLDGRTQLGAAAIVLALGLASVSLLNRLANVDVVQALREAAARIADSTGARYVVFGHSHHAELVDLHAAFSIGRFGERAYYINSGSWVTREILRGAQGTGMTYVEINRQGAALKKWRGIEQEPQILQRSAAPAAQEA